MLTPTMLIKILINLIIFILIFSGSIIYLFRLKLEAKGYKYLFITYIIYWMSIMLLRPYRGTLQKLIDPEFVTIVLSAYGFIGIFIRPFADWFNYLFKNRKSFLYFGVIFQLICFIPLLVVPNNVTSYLQSIAIGVGASCIGSFELLFKEQFNPKKSYLTISILSIPPLIANFLTSPIQSIMVSISKVNGKIHLDTFKYMWVIGISFALIALIALFFIKENKLYFGSLYKKENIIKNKNQYLNLILLSISGLLITFIKFSNSDAVATLHLQKLGQLNNMDTSGYEGYLSVVFSLFQLIGGVLVGTVLIKRMKSIYIFLIGSIIWILYDISSIFNSNPISFMVIHALNGFGYGILYNLVLGKVLNYSFKTKKVTPMGVYQSILAIGITCSSFYTNIIKNYINHKDTLSGFMDANKFIDIGLIIGIILLCIFYSINYYFIENKNRKNINNFIIN